MQRVNRSEQRLLDIYRALSDEQRDGLLQYAEFALQRAGPPAIVPRERLDIPRPAEESVVKAIQRLTSTYPMLAPDQLLHETSRFMSEHVMEGRGAQEVIDDLEALFENHYRRFLDESD